MAILARLSRMNGLDFILFLFFWIFIFFIIILNYYITDVLKMGEVDDGMVDQVVEMDGFCT